MNCFILDNLFLSFLEIQDKFFSFTLENFKFVYIWFRHTLGATNLSTFYAKYLSFRSSTVGSMCVRYRCSLLNKIKNIKSIPQTRLVYNLPWRYGLPCPRRSALWAYHVQKHLVPSVLAACGLGQVISRTVTSHSISLLWDTSGCTIDLIIAF